MNKNSSYKSFRLWSQQNNNESDNNNYQGLDQKQLIPVLISAIKDLSSKVDKLEKYIETLEMK